MGYRMLALRRDISSGRREVEEICDVVRVIEQFLYPIRRNGTLYDRIESMEHLSD